MRCVLVALSLYWYSSLCVCELARWVLLHMWHLLLFGVCLILLLTEYIFQFCYITFLLHLLTWAFALWYYLKFAKEENLYDNKSCKRNYTGIKIRKSNLRWKIALLFVYIHVYIHVVLLNLRAVTMQSHALHIFQVAHAITILIRMTKLYKLSWQYRRDYLQLTFYFIYDAKEKAVNHTLSFQKIVVELLLEKDFRQVIWLLELYFCNWPQV